MSSINLRKSLVEYESKDWDQMSEAEPSIGGGCPEPELSGGEGRSPLSPKPDPGFPGRDGWGCNQTYKI